MSPAVDLSTWLTEAEAARHMNIGLRTLQRMYAPATIASGTIGPERRELRTQGKRPSWRYRPEDVERMAPRRELVIASDSRLAPRPPAVPDAAMIAVLEAVNRLTAAVEATRPAPPAAQWLTIPQASEYSGISIAFLTRMIRARALSAIADRAIKVRRSDLDNLANSGDVARLAKFGQQLKTATSELRTKVAAKKRARR